MSHFEKPALNDEFMAYIKEDEDDICHYGMPRRSGRYPWGSGDDPYQRTGDLLSRAETLKKQGKTETEIAEMLNIINPRTGKPSTTRLRVQLDMARENRRAELVGQAKRLRYKEGLSLNEVAKRMGFKNDSSVRSLLNENSEQNMNAAKATAEKLKALINEKGPIDVGGDVEYSLNISKQKLDQALYRLELEGYPTYGARVPQATNPNQLTTLKVLCPPGTKHKEIYQFIDENKINSVDDYISRDGGETYEKAFKYPKSMDSNRLMIRYKEDGGIEKDGLVELRPGVKDLSLGNSHFSQVRILVDDKKYIKGMAVYGDPKDFPKGVDVIFNTNKGKNVSKLEVLKDIKSDPDNPFGSAIKEHGGQYEYIDDNGKKQLGLINKRSDEGDWSEWKDKVPSQFLSKQPIALVKRQLGLAIASKEEEYSKICELTNPTVKKKMLDSFASDCDSAAVHLYAAALPRQKYHVIIPITSMKDTEIYAPKYENGEKVALVRYPHGGTFEIPILTVNNKVPLAKKLLGTDPIDGVGINSKVAERLSGADFDGDTVMVIPTGGKNKINIKSRNELEGLKGFDPKDKYGTEKKEENGETTYYSKTTGRKVKIMANTQVEMGMISNLISDMTLVGAKDDELAAAVRHSMVVIDAEKHKLDYKQSYLDNHIESLKKKYQGYYDADGKYHSGASTLISRAKSETSILKRQGSPNINQKGKDWYDPTKEEGALIYKTADDLYYPIRKYNKKTGMVELRTTTGTTVAYNPTGGDKKIFEPHAVKDEATGKVRFFNKDGSIEYKTKARTQPSTQMEDTDDARSLISEANTAVEREYANYANTMKKMAIAARKEMVYTGSIKVDREVSKAYSKEVKSLEDKLKKSRMNHPKERMANLEVSSIVSAKVKANPNLKNDEIKKMRQQELVKARLKYNAKREEIDITPKEWEAIQKGAISETKLKQILLRANLDKVREYATPRKSTELNNAQISKIKTWKSKGYTIDEIAKALGISTSTVSKYTTK